jgi:hypothetical protein
MSYAFRNDETGDVIEVPPPNFTGRSVIRFNGKVVERVTYSDLEGGSVTTEDGRIYTSKEWPQYLVEQLRIDAWKVIH